MTDRRGTVAFCPGPEKVAEFVRSVGIKARISVCLHSAAVKTVPSVSSVSVFVLYGRVRTLRSSLKCGVGDSRKEIIRNLLSVKIKTKLNRARIIVKSNC